MTSISGYTVSELMEKTGKSRSAVESWISLHKVKPIINEFLYPPETLERLLAAKRGRPKNPAITNLEAAYKEITEVLKTDGVSWETVKKGKAKDKSLKELREIFNKVFHDAIRNPSRENNEALEKLIFELNDSNIVELDNEFTNALEGLLAKDAKFSDLLAEFRNHLNKSRNPKPKK